MTHCFEKVLRNTARQLFPLYSCHSEPSRAALNWTLASIVSRLLNFLAETAVHMLFLCSFSLSCLPCGLNAIIHETTHSQAMHNSNLLFLLSFDERFLATNDA